MPKTTRTTVPNALVVLLFALALAPAALAQPDGSHSLDSHSHGHATAGERPGLFFVGYRDLRGGADGVALLDLDPDSDRFGSILQIVTIGTGVLPHHLYFDREERRLYTTALGGSFLYEILLEHDERGVPTIISIEPIDTGDNIVGENIYFSRDGSLFYMTFLGGHGDERNGSVGIFDARTNRLIDSITAPASDDRSVDEPFLMYTHGISANEDLGLLAVTSTIHPDLTSAVGNTVTFIDLETHDVLATHLVADDPDDLTAPVEVLLLRDDFPPYALATAMLGGDIWISAYDAGRGAFGSFERAVDGADLGASWPLELYIHTDEGGTPELYVSFAMPGVVHVFSLASLPELPLVRTLPAAAGAHHMAFFTSSSGRELMVVQNNLLNLEGLDDGSLMIVDIHSGEVLATVAMAEEHGLMPESIESAFGHGHDYHH